LRFNELQQNLIFRSNFVHKVRNFLQSENFLDIETPTLFRRTPGGAREFIVPTHTSGEFYSLTQSPQQFKQLLMIAGLDRYYQIAKCYRDEGTKLDRQPEFTQIDIEMSFCDKDDVIGLVERLIQQCWPFNDTKPVEMPIQRMTFNHAMATYGVDKPDIRFDFKFKDLTELTTLKSGHTGVDKLNELINKDNFNINGFKVI
jgi:aspartyl-tRNA synthetase